MSFDIALSGIHAVDAQLDAISNNIANSGTYGFKSSRVNFSSMMAGTEATGAEASSTTQSIGNDGGVVTTGGAMDAAIQGRGFFVSRDSSGATLYSRVGMFSVDKNGYVIDGNGRRAQGFGVVPGSTTLGAMGDIQVPTGQIAAQASTSMQYVGNLSADWTTPAVAPFNSADPQTFNSSTVSVVYDSLGAQHSMTQYFVHTGANQVTVNYTLDGAPIAATTTLDFGPNGQLAQVNGAAPAPTAVALGTPTGAAALAVNLDYAGSTQFAGAANTTTNRADGYASGTFTGVSIADDGSVMATYSNGQKQSVGTLALATFPDEQALVAVSDTSWTVSNASGQPLYFAPGSGMAGSLTTGALEQSNVDITSELVNLMTSQRNYQANSKVIQTESAMLQALMQAI
jgi:flagellar hook protein FlgE